MNKCPICGWEGRIAESHTRWMQVFMHIEHVGGRIVTCGSCTKPIERA